MKKLILFSLQFFCSIWIFSQENLNTILRSPTVKDDITLRFLDKELEFALDSGAFKTVDSINYLQAKSAEIRISSRFINPLKYQISVVDTKIEDPLIKAAEEFLTSLGTSFQGLSSSRSREGDGKTAIAKYPITNRILVELYTALYGTDATFFDQGKYLELLILMSSFSLEQQQSSINSNYDIMFTNLIAISSYDQIDAKIGTNELLNNAIEGNIKTLENNFKKLNEAATVAINKLINSDNSTIEQNQGNLIKLKIAELKEEYDHILSSIKDLSQKYEILNRLFSDYKAKFDKELESFKVYKVKSIDRKNLRIIKIYLKKLVFDTKKKTLSEEGKREFLIQIRKYTSFIPIVSGGVIYTNLKFPTFGTGMDESGNTIVTQGEDKANELSIASYLNLYYNQGKENAFPFFIQIGAGPSKERPLFFLGGGINPLHRITISLGAVFTWFPELNSLSVGDPVTGTTEIEEDIRYNFTGKPKFYFGISYNFNK